MIQLLCVVIFSIIVGLAICFNGYRWFWILLPIWGFFAGFALSAHTMAAIFGTSFLADILGWVVGFVVGLIAAVLSYLIFPIGIAIMGGSLGWMLTTGLLDALGLGPGFLVSCIALIAGILFGLFFLRGGVQKFLIVGLTALLGAAAITVGATRVLISNLRTVGFSFSKLLLYFGY